MKCEYSNEQQLVSILLIKDYLTIEIETLRLFENSNSQQLVSILRIENYLNTPRICSGVKHVYHEYTPSLNPLTDWLGPCVYLLFENFET